MEALASGHAFADALTPSRFWHGGKWLADQYSNVVPLLAAGPHFYRSLTLHDSVGAAPSRTMGGSAAMEAIRTLSQINYTQVDPGSGGGRGVSFRDISI